MRHDYWTFSDASFRNGKMGYAFIIMDNNTFVASEIVSGIVVSETNTCKGELWGYK